MTWYGYILIGLYAFAIGYNLVRIGQGGYTYVYTVGILVASVILQALSLTALLLVGTGHV